MAYYKVHSGRRNRLGHLALIGPPLVITMAFCFGLVLMQPSPQPQRAPAASRHVTPVTAAQQLPLSSTSLESQTTLSHSSSSSSGGTTTNSTANSSNLSTEAQGSTPMAQATPASNTALQAATPNNQHASGILQPIAHQLKNALKSEKMSGYKQN